MKSTLRFDASALPDASTALPSEFRILRFGQNKFWKIGRDEEGELLFDAESAKSVMERFASKGLDSIAIDLDHKIVQGGNSDTAGKAYGWFVPEVRSDGLYAANVKWTPEGEALLKGKSYRFFSPTVQTDDDGRVTDLLPLALTNMPALKGIPALVAANATSKGTKSMKTILTALNLGDDTDETIALSAVETIKADAATLLGLFNAKTAAEAVGIFTAMKAQADKVEALSAEVTALRAEKTAAEINSLLDEAVKDGRVAPAKRGDMLALSAQYGVEALKACLSVMGKQPAQAAPVQPPKEEPKAVALAAADVNAVAGIFGIAPESLVAGRVSLPTSSKPDSDTAAVANVFGVSPQSLTARNFSLPIARPGDDR